MMQNSHLNTQNIWSTPMKGKSSQFAKHVLNGLSAHIAVIDETGVIIAVNEAWRQFAVANPPLNSNVLRGANYLAICDAAQGADSDMAVAFAAGLRSVLLGERPFFQLEYPCHSPDEKRWFIGRVTRYSEDDGAIRAIVAHENITARKLAEDELLKFSRAVEQAPVSILFTDEKGSIEYVNPKLTELTGYAADEMVGQTPSLFKSGRTSAATYEQMWGAITAGQAWHGEFLNQKKDGTLFWESASISPLTDKTGEIISFIAVKKDITEQKRVAAILAESEQRYKALFENANDAIFVNDANGRFLDANHVACQRLGYSLKELKEMRLADIDPIEYTHLKPERFGPLKKESYAFFETIHVTKNGKTIPTEINVQYFQYGEQKALLSIARDITERNKIIRAERESRQFAELLAETAVLINQSLTVDQVLSRILNNVDRAIAHEMATIMLIDGEFAQIIDIKANHHTLTSHALKGMRLKIADFPTLTTMIDSQEALVLPFVTKYSGWVQMPAFQETRSYVGAPICAEGKVLGFINLASSQSQTFSHTDAVRLQTFADYAAIAIKNAQLCAEVKTLNANLEAQVQIRSEQVRHEKELLEAILFDSPNTILYANLKGNILLANSIFYETFNLTESEVIGHQLTAVLATTDQAMLEEKLETVIRTSQPQQLESVVTLKNESKLNVEFRMAPVKNGTLSGVVYTILNLTSFKITERAKDAFVSNVSHELRSPITSIKLNQELLRKKPENLSRYLPRLERETDRLNQLINDLLYLSSVDQNQIIRTPSHFDLNQLVFNLTEDRQIIASLNGLMLNFDKPERSLLIHADMGMIEQVLSILLTNAIAYTPPTGQIWVSTHLHKKNNTGWCGVSIRDTGLGIAPDEQPKIFERFYRGNAGIASEAPGTGLGLAIAAEIIARHQGEIEVQSEGLPGKGSTFTIWLPIHEATVS